jgi:hypothetical protein
VWLGLRHGFVWRVAFGLEGCVWYVGCRFAFAFCSLGHKLAPRNNFFTTPKPDVFFWRETWAIILHQVIPLFFVWFRGRGGLFGCYLGSGIRFAVNVYWACLLVQDECCIPLRGIIHCGEINVHIEPRIATSSASSGLLTRPESFSEVSCCRMTGFAEFCGLLKVRFLVAGDGVCHRFRWCFFTLVAHGAVAARPPRASFSSTNAVSPTAHYIDDSPHTR